MFELKELKQLTKDLNILYVEDDLGIQKTMFNYLKKLFSSITIANDGVQGLNLFEKNKFDIVITDLSMPKMNGLEMIQKIKEIDENQLILITTAHSESNYTMGAIKAHVDGYILKPFNYDELNFELFKISQIINKFNENENYKQHLEDMIELKTKEMQNNYEKTLYSMIDLVEQRDTYTAGHSKRVANYCQLIAKEMGYSQEDQKLIHQAGILHDIGKIETPDAVLLNPKGLNEIEYLLIKEHVNVGYQLLNSIPMFKHLAKIVYLHHERYDGEGYPNGLAGDDIDELGRIIIVADAFDAMTTNRIYKARKTIEEAIEEILVLSEKQFHPDVAKSAAIALKNIELDQEINQLPKTKLEEERFAYFYKDILTQAYNQNYLDVVLMKNSYNLEYSNMAILSLKEFSKYNQNNGWEKGDEVLKEFANILLIHLDENLIFRIFGDDFVLLSKKDIDLSEVKIALDTLVQKEHLIYKTDIIDLNILKINTLSDIEIQLNKITT